MITMIHGDDISSSRKYYKSLQTNHGETLDGEKLTFTRVDEMLQSSGLFEEDKYIYIENFFSKRKISKEMEQIVHALLTANDQTTIILWESKELTKKTIDRLKNAQVKLFSIPKSLFLFTDSIKPHNTTQMLSLYHKTLQHTEAEMILAMLIRQIRLLLALSDTQTTDSIDEIKRMAPWQQKKLSTQSKQFPQETLKKLHTTLFDIEVKSKTGGLPLPLSQSIDFFLSTI